jgi:hypothetical protein
MNLFKEYNKQIFNYKSLFGIDSLKSSKKLIESLLEIKKLFLIDNEKKLHKKNENFLLKIFKAMFYSKLTK